MSYSIKDNIFKSYFMFLHLGENVVIPQKEVIAIFNIETANAIDTRHFLKDAKEEGFIEKINNDEPKFFIVTERKNYFIILVIGDGLCLLLM